MVLPNICWVLNLITLLVSEDEGSHRHVINVLSNPVHLGHHPVHSIQIFSYDMVLFKEVLLKCVFLTRYDYYCASTRNIHSIGLWDKIETIAWFFIFQCHDYLWMIVIIHIKFERFKPVASYVKAHNQSWGWSNCPWYPDLGSKKQIYLQIPISLHWIKLSSLYCLSSGWFLETF